jgi:hypothetical protein
MKSNLKTKPVRHRRNENETCPLEEDPNCQMKRIGNFVSPLTTLVSQG